MSNTDTQLQSLMSSTLSRVRCNEVFPTVSCPIFCSVHSTAVSCPIFCIVQDTAVSCPIFCSVHSTAVSYPIFCSVHSTAVSTIVSVQYTANFTVLQTSPLSSHVQYTAVFDLSTDTTPQPPGCQATALTRLV